MTDKTIALGDLSVLACKLMKDIHEKAEVVGLDGLNLWEEKYNNYPSYKFEEEKYVELMANKYVDTHADCVEVIVKTMVGV